ncbi:MAG: DNA topoisomerase VI, partial [Planctomycetia bacterium]|nr:DNA topoisomerase VI [Planctomycetia bacterium]
MAKKKATSTEAPEKTPASDSEKNKKRKPQDERTLAQIRSLADTVVQTAARKREPSVAIPARSLSNIRFNPTKRILEMGKRTTSRELFNIGQAKSFMQTMLVASGTKQLIEMGKTTSIRGLYYML